MDWGRKWLIDFNAGEIQLVLFDPVLTIRKKVQQQVFAVDICQFEGISMAKI